MEKDTEFSPRTSGESQKEEGRRDFISSSSEIDRAKALFFVVDVLTGVIVPEGNNFTVLVKLMIQERAQNSLKIN